MSETNIHIHPGSILDVWADAIVNPANSFLDHKGGLARIIAETAAAPFDPGPLDQYTVPTCGCFGGPLGCIEAQRRGDPCPSPTGLIRQARDAHNERVAAWVLDHERAPLIATGNAHHTSPGALPFKGCIHAVGPIWNGGDFMERGLLETAHERVLRICQAHDYTSVVFPAISCGVFGFPVYDAAKIAVEVGGWGIDYGVKDVTFAVMGDEHEQAYRDALTYWSAG